jgi:hypothetical protein
VVTTCSSPSWKEMISGVWFFSSSSTGSSVSPTQRWAALNIFASPRAHGCLIISSDTDLKDKPGVRFISRR